MPAAPHYAVIGAGMAGIACARTLLNAGLQVSVFEKQDAVGGRMATCRTPFGSFDHGAQYFTVRDERFALALQTVPDLCRPWSANAVRVLDALGRVAEAALPAPQPHYVAKPTMDSLLTAWAQPLQHQGVLQRNTRVARIERDALNPRRWQLRTEETAPGSADGAQHVYSGFDGVLLALPHAQALQLLQDSQQGQPFQQAMADVQVAPCWTLMLAFPQASQPGISYLGPQWNAALSTHHRVAWLARESSKPGREPIERWTVQASAAWSQEHLRDSEQRVQAKLVKAFAEITGIRAQPSYAEVHRWRQAKTLTPLGQAFLWDRQQGLGLMGDWCLGHRVENAFVSGLELALAVVG